MTKTTKKKRRIGFKEGVWVCRRGHAIELPTITMLNLSPCSPCPRCNPERYEVVAREKKQIDAAYRKLLREQVRRSPFKPLFSS